MTKSEQHEFFIDGLGLPNFKGKEFTPYWSRTRNGVKNSLPPEALWPNIIRTLVVLQALRTDLGSSISLLSTYRSPAYNTAIAGAGASFHMEYKAIDFTCASGTPADWARKLKSYRGKKFTVPGMNESYVFRGGVGLYPTFVHVDTRGTDANW